MTGFERGAPNGIHGNKTDGVSNKTTNIYNIHNIHNIYERTQHYLHYY